MADAPILCQWDGEAMRPAGPLWAKRADQQWTVGERYMIEIRQDRSAASHRAYFAQINEIFQNLPDHLAERFPDADRLRKWALCMTGFCDEQSYVASSRSKAVELAGFIRSVDNYAIISISGSAVVVRTARSQSMRAMGKAEFERSKTVTLDYLAGIIGVSPEALQRNTGVAA